MTGCRSQNLRVILVARNRAAAGSGDRAARLCQRALPVPVKIRVMMRHAELLRAMPAAGPHGFTARELFNTALLQGLDPRPVMASGALDDLPVPFGGTLQRSTLRDRGGCRGW
jgi:hypothetical protein